MDRQELVPMDYEFVDRLIRQHEEGFDHAHRLWVLYVFHLWAQTVGAVTAIDRLAGRGLLSGRRDALANTSPIASPGVSSC
jgi:hypothetical protein